MWRRIFLRNGWLPSMARNSHSILDGPEVQSSVRVRAALVFDFGGAGIEGLGLGIFLVLSGLLGVEMLPR